jgi:hypothetical protein
MGDAPPTKSAAPARPAPRRPGEQQKPQPSSEPKPQP